MGVHVCTADAAGMCSLTMNELLWCACMSADGGSAKEEGGERERMPCLLGRLLATQRAPRRRLLPCAPRLLPCAGDCFRVHGDCYRVHCIGYRVHVHTVTDMHMVTEKSDMHPGGP